LKEIAGGEPHIKQKTIRSATNDPGQTPQTGKLIERRGGKRGGKGGAVFSEPQKKIESRLLANTKAIGGLAVQTRGGLGSQGRET